MIIGTLTSILGCYVWIYLGSMSWTAFRDFNASKHESLTGLIRSNLSWFKISVSAALWFTRVSGKVMDKVNIRSMLDLRLLKSDEFFNSWVINTGTNRGTWTVKSFPTVWTRDIRQSKSWGLQVRVYSMWLPIRKACILLTIWVSSGLRQDKGNFKKVELRHKAAHCYWILFALRITPNKALSISWTYSNTTFSSYSTEKWKMLETTLPRLSARTTCMLESLVSLVLLVKKAMTLTNWL